MHGRADLLGDLHGHIRDHNTYFCEGRPAEIVYLGDYIDGGPQSLECIDLLIAGISGFRTVCLLGNHEAMMLDCLASDDRNTWYTWLSNGGETMGISHRFGGYNPAALKEALGEKRIAWLKSLPFWHRVGPYLFVHAGIVPGVPIEQQRTEDLLWIRSRFLESDEDHGAIVVHGHTPRDEPEVRHNRIGIDTGATSNGRLTAVILDGHAKPQFLVARRPGNQ